MIRIVLIVLMLLLTACGGSRAVAPVWQQGYGTKSKPSHVKYASSKPPVVYRVKKGDTLYSISWRYGMDYKTLARINHIHSPYKLAIGQKLRFKSSKATAKRTTSSNKAKTTKPVKKAKVTKPAISNVKLRWRWPTRGKILSTFSKSATGRKGIDIAGKAGQTIVAAAPGKVVYAGNGLPRYGNLLIIKHNDSYLSAYAHNTTLLVKEGQYVKAGQRIARLGSTGTQRNQLHFEIRRNGKPVDPLQFLPKR